MDPNLPHTAPNLKRYGRGIHDLPPEVLFLIFWRLHGQDVARCTRVSRFISELIQADIYLQYNIELAKNGMIDGLSSTLHVSERLQRIRRYSSNFHNGIFNHEDITTAHPGYLHQLRTMGSSGWSRRAGVTSVFYISDSGRPYRFFITVFIDPSAQAGVQSRRLIIPMRNLEDRDGYTRDWNIDREQDLLVTVECFSTGTNTRASELHLCSWSGSQVGHLDHPAAMEARVQISPLAHVIQQIHIRPTIIAGCYIVWKSYPTGDGASSDYIQVYNWTTGKMVSRIYLEDGDHSFVLLDDTYILVLHEESRSECPFESHISVYSLALPSAIHPLCSLQLPPLTLSPGECIEYRVMYTSRHPPEPEAHFRDDPAVSMVVLAHHLAIEAETPMRPLAKSRNSYLLMPCAALLSQIRAVVDSNPDPLSPPVLVPWQDWGARASLRLWVPMHPHPRHISDDILLVPYSSRMPIVLFDDPDCTRLSVYVFETNPLVVRHARAMLTTATRANSELGSGVYLGMAETETETTTRIAVLENVDAVLPGIVDLECSTAPFVVYRFGIPLPEVDHYSWREVHAVRMSMTGFTVTFGDGPNEMDYTWTV